MSQINHYKNNIPVGWHKLLDLLQEKLDMEQSFHMKTVKGEPIFKKSDKPIFNFTVFQIKEKFGSLRIYSSLEAVDHDWDIFDKDSYDKNLFRLQHTINGFICCLQTISYYTCEVTGQPGIIRDLNGWLKCLCDEEFEKLKNYGTII